MNVISIDEVKSGAVRPEHGDRIAFVDPKGRVIIGTVRAKKVRCGKKECNQCPHEKYFYAQYRDGEKVKEKYIGVAR